MEPFWVFVAFTLGFAATRLGLPPLVGYLTAGFVLNALGAQGGEIIEAIADLGVTLLLFSIGLKLKLRSLTRPEIWFGASAHMLITVVFFGLCIFGIGRLGLPYFAGFDLKLAILLAFALSFSSTVFAVKALEARGEMTSLHGRIGIGILIMQDIIAVLFLTFSSGEMPTAWALALPVVLYVLRPLLMVVLDRSGHRELLLLFAVFLALGLGAGGFELVGLKPALGALVMGILVSGHPKADELAEVLLSFKDLFLVGFFLTIGLSAVPSLGVVVVATLLAAAVPFKVALFFVLLTRFKLRSRTAVLASFSLANYSEFGLVVGALCVKNGWLAPEWLVVIAIALSISFILASPLNAAAHTLYARYCKWLKRFETLERHPDDQPVDTGDAEIIIFGMGRVGAAAYDAMRMRYADSVLGIDYDAEVVESHRSAGRKVIQNDATDSDFWEVMRPSARVKLIMLAMASHAANVYAAKRFSQSDYAGMLAAIAHYDDQAAELEALGVSVVFNYYTEVGIGFADQVCEKFSACKTIYPD